MANKSFFRRSWLFTGVIFGLLLILALTGVVHAVIQIRKLSGLMTIGGDVWNFKVSPDGRYVVFLGDVRTDGIDELFSAPTIGGENVRISGDIKSGCVINSYFITPNSEIVVFYASTVTGENCGLFAVPIVGGTPIELFSATPGFLLRDIKITNNSENVIFIMAQMELPPQSMIHRVPIGGGDADLLSYVCTGELNYQVTPDSQYVVFRYYTTTGVSQLIRSTMEGTQETLINSLNHISQFDVSSDGAYVVYLEEIMGTNELFSIPVEGGDPKKLNGDLVVGGEVLGFKIAPNSAYVIYLADETFLDRYLIYRASIYDSGTGVQLIPPSITDPNENVTSFLISPNSQWVVYRGDFRVDERFELFSVSLHDGVNYCLTSLIIPEGDVGAYKITPNSLGVVFIADGLMDEVDELFAVFLNGLGIRRLNEPLPDGGDVNSFKISPNSQGVVYRADQDEDEVFNLYAIPTLRTVGVMPLQVNSDLGSDGDVDFNYEITPDNKGVLYIADQDVDDVWELFITYDYQMVYLPMVVK